MTPPRTRRGVAFDVAARLGSVVTLAGVLVVGATVAGVAGAAHSSTGPAATTADLTTPAR